MSIQELEAAILKLPAKQRARLAHKLIQSLRASPPAPRTMSTQQTIPGWVAGTTMTANEAADMIHGSGALEVAIAKARHFFPAYNADGDDTEQAIDFVLSRIQRELADHLPPMSETELARAWDLIREPLRSAVHAALT